MSLLNPGGSRAAPASRIFGYDNIKRTLQRKKRDHLRGAEGSIAAEPHEHNRETARRLRQQARRTK